MRKVIVNILFVFVFLVLLFILASYFYGNLSKKGLENYFFDKFNLTTCNSDKSSYLIKTKGLEDVFGCEPEVIYSIQGENLTMVQIHQYYGSSHPDVKSIYLVESNGKILEFSMPYDYAHYLSYICTKNYDTSTCYQSSDSNPQYLFDVYDVDVNGIKQLIKTGDTYAWEIHMNNSSIFSENCGMICYANATITVPVTGSYLEEDCFTYIANTAFKSLTEDYCKSLSDYISRLHCYTDLAIIEGKNTSCNDFVKIKLNSIHVWSCCEEIEKLRGINCSA